MIHIFLLLALVSSGSVLIAEDRKPKLNQEEAERLVFASWRRVFTEKEGVSHDSELCFEFSSEGFEAWQWAGELSVAKRDKGGRIIVDCKTEPKHIDFYATREGKVVYVMPCIWKVEGEGKDIRLIIVEPDGSEKPREGGDYSKSTIRPTSFETTKAKKYTMDTYVPCEYMEQHSEKREKEIRERLKAWEK